MSIKFNIKTKLPTLNEYINIERANKFGAFSIKRKYTDICGVYALSIKKKINPIKRYNLILNWQVENNKSDPDNIYFGVKFVLDGMVQQGILKNDGRKNISSIHNNISTSKKYNLEVILMETDD